MAAETEAPPMSRDVPALRDQARKALLTKQRGEARAILGKLILFSGDQNDKDLLSALISGVKEEVKRYVSKDGSFRDRLLNGAPLHDIQKGLAYEIPYWRAFANDLEDLQLVRDGLPAHEDPVLKTRLKAIEGNLAVGAVDEAIQEWKGLGSLSVAASATFAQIMDVLLRLSERMAGEEWTMAETIRAEAIGLLELEQSVSCRQGCESYLRNVKIKLDREKFRLDWERYLEETSDISKLSNLDRQKVSEELCKAKNFFQEFTRTEYWYKEALERVNNTLAGIQQLEERLRAMRSKLAEGKVLEVLVEWEKRGTMPVAVDVGLIQMVDALSRLLKALEGKKWAAAEAIRSEAVRLLESDECASFRLGCKHYLEKVGNKLAWERVLEKTTNPSLLGQRERLKVREELHTAQVQLGMSTKADSSINETLERINKAIERIEQIPDEPPKEDGGGNFLKVLVVVVTLIVLTAIGCWAWASRFAPN